MPPWYITPFQHWKILINFLKSYYGFFFIDVPFYTSIAFAHSLLLSTEALWRLFPAFCPADTPGFAISSTQNRMSTPQMCSVLHSPTRETAWLASCRLQPYSLHCYWTQNPGSWGSLFPAGIQHQAQEEDVHGRASEKHKYSVPSPVNTGKQILHWFILKSSTCSFYTIGIFFPTF